MKKKPKPYIAGNEWDAGRFAVVRYPLYFVVIDQSVAAHTIVYESRNQDSAHRMKRKLNKAWGKPEGRDEDVADLNVLAALTPRGREAMLAAREAREGH